MELGRSVKGKGYEFLGLFENIDGDPRGHILHYAARFKIKGFKEWLVPIEEGEKAFFKELPKKIIPYQKDFLNKLGYK